MSSAVAGGGFGLHGMWLDEGTGLYYVRARTYDAKTGRFLSRDPVAGVVSDARTYTPYVFAAQNPELFTDPTGMNFTLPGLMAAVVISGVLAGLATAVFNFSHFKCGRISAGQYAGSIFVGAVVGGTATFVAAELGLVGGVLASGVGGGVSEALNQIVTGQIPQDGSGPSIAIATVGGAAGMLAAGAVGRVLRIAGQIDLAEIFTRARGVHVPVLQVTGRQYYNAAGGVITPWVRADAILKLGESALDAARRGHNALVDAVIQPVVNGSVGPGAQGSLKASRNSPVSSDNGFCN